MLDRHADDLAVFFNRHGGRLARGADHANAVSAFGDVPVNETAQGGVIDAAIFLHRGDQCDDAANDGFHSSSSESGNFSPASGGSAQASQVPRHLGTDLVRR